MIRAILADDAEVMRKAISSLLRKSPSVKLRAETSGFRRLVVEHRPDIIILDIRMPDSGKVSADELKSCLGTVRLWQFLFLTTKKRKSRKCVRRLFAVAESVFSAVRSRYPRVRQTVTSPIRVCQS